MRKYNNGGGLLLLVLMVAALVWAATKIPDRSHPAPAASIEEVLAGLNARADRLEAGLHITVTITVKNDEVIPLVVPEGFRWDYADGQPATGVSTGPNSRDAAGNCVARFRLWPPLSAARFKVIIAPTPTPQTCGWKN